MTGSQAERLIFSLTHELVLSSIAQVRDVALKHCASLLYKPEQFSSDLADYVEDFATLGVPPLGSPPTRQVSLATIFNVGQVVAMEHLDRFYPGETLVRKWQRLDDLILKAIELAEVQFAWERAAP